MKLNLNRAFVKTYADSFRALLRAKPGGWFGFSWPMTEQRYFAQVERELTNALHEAEAWAYVERSLTHYARRGWR